MPDSLGISVSVDTDAFEAMISQLLKPKADKPIAVALRDTSKNGKVRAASLIAKHMNTRVATVKDRIYTDFVQPGVYQTHIRASRKPISLGQFPVRQTSEGVMTRAWGKPQTLRGAFLTTVGRGHTGVFRRRPGAGRLPIYELWGPTVAGTFTTEVVRHAIEARLRDQLPKNLAKHLQAAIRRARIAKR